MGLHFFSQTEVVTPWKALSGGLCRMPTCTQASSAESVDDRPTGLTQQRKSGLRNMDGELCLSECGWMEQSKY